jgi:DNA-binding HxlR family transcriptional regulator
MCPQPARGKDASLLCSDAIKVNANHRGGQVSILRCKRWSCEICHPIQRRRVISYARKGVPDRFVTLTCKPDLFETPDQAARAMRDAFAKLIRLIRKENPGRTVEYMRVFEATKAGWPHLHILMRTPWISQQWLSDTWKRLTGAFIVDVRQVKNIEHAAYYVAKYIGKALARFKGVTRWFRSRNWNEPRNDDDRPQCFGSHWDKIEGKPHLMMWRFIFEAKANGYLIEEQRSDYLRWLIPPKKE